VFGILVFYAGEADAFGPEEIDLLNELAGDLAFGIYARRVGAALRDSMARLKLQFDRMPVGCVVWNPKFLVQSWNPAAEKIFGFTASEAMGKHPYELIVPKDVQPHVDDIWSRLLAGDTTAHSVNENVSKDGRTIICDWTNTPLKEADGGVVGVLSMIQDITELKRTEEELRNYRQHLEEIVTLRTSDLVKANERLEATNKELESFSYSISHDLRVPLRAIDGFSRILLEDYSTKLDAEGQRVLNVVRDSTVKMAGLIDDIIAFSGIGRNEMTSARIDMDGLVHAILEELQPVLAGRKVTFDIKPLTAARGDAGMIRRVWTNLIDNAVKFTSVKPEAIIEVGSTAGQEETIYYVKDNGAGFDMQYANKLFGAFQRLHGAEFAGAGIGLAIVKRIIARHGGRVWAEGKVSEGATFYFTLPVRENSHA
jgi:two-component system sensor kinase